MASIICPPTLECRVKERHNTAIHSYRVSELFLVQYVKWTPPFPPVSHPFPGGHGESLDIRVDMVSIKVWDRVVRLDGEL